MEEKKNINILLYILIGVFILGLGAIIYILLVSDKNDKVEEKNDDKTQTVILELTESANKVWYYMEKNSDNFEYPVVNIDTVEVKELNHTFKDKTLNTKILDYNVCNAKCFNGINISCDPKEHLEFCKALQYSYNVIEFNDIFTLVEKEYTGVVGGGFVDFYYLYSFSKEKNKKLSNQEILDNYDKISKTKFLDDFSKYVKNYDELNDWLSFQRGYNASSFSFDLEKMNIGAYDSARILVEFVMINDGSIFLLYDGNSFVKAEF